MVHGLVEAFIEFTAFCLLTVTVILVVLTLYGVVEWL